MRISELNRRRWRNFKSNRRAFFSLWIFGVLFGLSLFAEFIANDKPILVRYHGEFYMPIFRFYPETAFGGDFRTEAIYRDPEVKCLIATGGMADPCFEIRPRPWPRRRPASIGGEKIADPGWAIWPPIPYSYARPVDIPGVAPSPPSRDNWLGTDDTKRDVLARVIYGFRLSVLFTLIVSTITA